MKEKDSEAEAARKNPQTLIPESKKEEMIPHTADLVPKIAETKDPKKIPESKNEMIPHTADLVPKIPETKDPKKILESKEEMIPHTADLVHKVPEPKDPKKVLESTVNLVSKVPEPKVSKKIHKSKKKEMIPLELEDQSPADKQIKSLPKEYPVYLIAGHISREYADLNEIFLTQGLGFYIVTVGFGGKLEFGYDRGGINSRPTSTVGLSISSGFRHLIGYTVNPLTMNLRVMNGKLVSGEDESDSDSEFMNRMNKKYSIANFNSRDRHGFQFASQLIDYLLQGGRRIIDTPLYCSFLKESEDRFALLDRLGSFEKDLYLLVATNQAGSHDWAAIAFGDLRFEYIAERHIFNVTLQEKFSEGDVLYGTTLMNGLELAKAAKNAFGHLLFEANDKVYPYLFVKILRSMVVYKQKFFR